MNNAASKIGIVLSLIPRVSTITSVHVAISIATTHGRRRAPRPRRRFADASDRAGNRQLGPRPDHRSLILTPKS